MQAAQLRTTCAAKFFAPNSLYLHLCLLPLLASSNGHSRCSFHFSFPKLFIHHNFHVSSCFHVHGLILIPNVSWDVFPCFSACFVSNVVGHRWPGAAPGRVARHCGTSEAGRTEPGRGSQNRTGNHFGNDWCLMFFCRLALIIIVSCIGHDLLHYFVDFSMTCVFCTRILFKTQRRIELMFFAFVSSTYDRLIRRGMTHSPSSG